MNAMRCATLVATLGAASVFCGCSQITLLRVAELQAVRAHIDTLAVRLDSTQQVLVREQRQQAELMRMVRADMQVRFSELAQRSSAIEGSLSESQARLTDIDRKTAEIRQRWDDKARQDSVKGSMVRAEEENLFQIAYTDFMAGRFDLSMGGFKDFVARFPESSLLERAVFGVAECHYAMKRHDAAETAFVAYLKSYPNGEKVCAALYKLGLSYDKLGKAKHQKAVWDKLQTQCPQSEEARAAASRSQ